ncbi:hypothetical protein N7486_010758 [Penicillium sp. IBT 16267x]|nr:hypothetical protein N7486_010758 [Penicillium sp. IBT 16267x]
MASIARICPRRALSSSVKQTQSLRPLTTASIRTTRPTTTPQPTRHHSHPRKYQSYQPRRPYHSSLHPALPVHEYTNSQIAILEASLAHTPVHGFTQTSILLGARDAGFLDVSVQLLPRGEYDLILFWLASRRGLLRAAVESGDIQFTAGQDVQSKIKTLIMKRMKMNEEVRGQWQDALAQMSLLGNIPLALSELHALSNDILSLAGDTSVDASWYTRRAAVAAIYASAEVVMTRDPTPDMSETESFVQRRFEDKDILAKKVEVVGQCVSFFGNTVVGVARSYGLKI